MFEGDVSHQRGTDTRWDCSTDEVQQRLLDHRRVFLAVASEPAVHVLTAVLTLHEVNRFAWVRQAVTSVDAQSLRMAASKALPLSASSAKRVADR